jgi:hypothetical protein
MMCYPESGCSTSSMGLLGPLYASDVFDSRSSVLWRLLLRRPQSDCRLHHRLPVRIPPRRSPAPDSHLARLRRQPHQCPGRGDPGPSSGPSRRQPSTTAHGHGHRRRRRRILEPTPRRRPHGDGHPRAHTQVPAPRAGPGPAADRHPGDLHGRLRSPAVGRAGPAADLRGGRHQPSDLDHLRPGPKRQPGRLRHGRGFRDRRRRHPRLRPEPHRRPHRRRRRRSLLPGCRHPDSRPTPQAIVEHSHGCHTSPFFRAQQPLSLQFLAEHLAA